jgi:hypothetical protein
MSSWAMTVLCQALCTMPQCSTDSHRSFVHRQVHSIAVSDYRSLQLRLLPHFPVTLCGKCETFEQFGSEEVAEVRRNYDPGATASTTPSAICLSSNTSLLYSLG